MREKPWQVVDLFTNETLEWCATDTDAWVKFAGRPVDVIYRPGRKKKVKK